MSGIVRIFNTYGPTAARRRRQGGVQPPRPGARGPTRSPCTATGARHAACASSTTRWPGILALLDSGLGGADEHREPRRAQRLGPGPRRARAHRLVVTHRVRAASHRRSHPAEARHLAGPEPARLGAQGAPRRGSQGDGRRFLCRRQDSVRRVPTGHDRVPGPDQLGGEQSGDARRKRDRERDHPVRVPHHVGDRPGVQRAPDPGGDHPPDPGGRASLRARGGHRRRRLVRRERQGAVGPAGLHRPGDHPSPQQGQGRRGGAPGSRRHAATSSWSRTPTSSTTPTTGSGCSTRS